MTLFRCNALRRVRSVFVTILTGLGFLCAASVPSSSAGADETRPIDELYRAKTS